MAIIDIPAGFVYDPKTRGAVNPVSGARISRRQLEKPRIAAETGTSGSFEAKARKAQLMGPPVRLPRRLKVHYTGTAVNAQRRELVGQTRYRVRTFPEVIGVVSSLPRGAELYVKMLARRTTVNYRGKRANPLVWVSLSSLFRAEFVMREYPTMASRRSDYFDIRAYDIIVRSINPYSSPYGD